MIFSLVIGKAQSTNVGMPDVNDLLTVTYSKGAGKELYRKTMQ